MSIIKGKLNVCLTYFKSNFVCGVHAFRISNLNSIQQSQIHYFSFLLRKIRLNKMQNVNSALFLKLGNQITETKCAQKMSIQERRFNSHFGISPYICEIVWKKIIGRAPVGYQPKHLLWGLNFLKQYTVEHNRHSLLKSDEKTIREWSWTTVKLLSDLDVIVWEDRKRGALPGATSFVSLDGIDLKIKEPQPFSPIYYSHKFKAAGLRYEIGLNIQTGDIVWKHGGFPCGSMCDLSLSRTAYVFSVDEGEKTLADKGYRDTNFFILPNAANAGLHKRIMSRHETVNKRIRQFQIIKQTYRHELKKHPMVFSAVLNLTQLKLENGQPLFTI